MWLPIIPHFIGASPGSTDIHTTLRRFCHEIYHYNDFESQKQARLSQVNDNDEKSQENRKTIEEEFSISQDIQELHQQFCYFLKQAATTSRVVLLIDALNQLNPPGDTNVINWLPYNFPANVRVIITSLANHAALDSLRHRGKGQIRERWLGELATEDRHAIITGFLYRYRKQMEREQTDNLLGKAESGNPLYLLTALEELRTLSSYEKISQHLKSMPDGVQDLFVFIFKRLENDPIFQDREGQPLGKKLISSFASLLGVSRFGLSETEVVELLAPGDPEAEPPIPDDSQGNVAALVRLLRPYLMSRGELIDFYHEEFRRAAESTFLTEEDARREAHGHLAKYFQHKADPVGDHTWLGDYPRALAEFPYHLAHGLQSGPFQETLTDFRFLQAKIKAFGVYPLIADYDLATISGINLNVDNQAALGLIQEALRLSAHIVVHDPNQLAGQLTGRLLWQKSQEIQTFLKNISLAKTESWLRPLSPTLTPAGGILLRTLTGHTGFVYNVALWPERGWAVSASQDCTLKVWDLETGQEIHTLAGHNGSVIYVLLWPEQGWAVSASVDQTLKVWDLETGQEIRTLDSGPISTLTLWPERGRAVAVSEKNNLKVWDLETGQELHTLIGHTDSISALSLWPERGWAVSASYDKTLKVWDLETGQEIHTLIGHNGFISTLALKPERGWAVSRSFDKILKVWDLERWQEINNFLLADDRHLRHDAVALWPSRGMAVWASPNNALKVWSLERGQDILTLTGHNSTVNAVALWPERNWAVSASEDCTLKVWDLDQEQEVHTLTGHDGPVTKVALCPEHGLAVSGSRDTLKVWDLESGQELHHLTGHNGDIRDLALWKERSWAVSASEDCTLRVWDLESGQEIHTLTGHDAIVDAVALWPERGWAVSSSFDKTLRVWDLESGQELHKLMDPGDHIINISVFALWEERGWVVFTFIGQTTLKVWDLETGREVRSLNSGPVSALALWPERGWIMSASGKTLKVWDLESGQELYTYTGHTGEFRALRQEQGWAALSSYEHNIKVWDLESGQEIRRFSISNEIKQDITQWPEQGLGVSDSEDYSLKVWDLETGHEIHTLTGHTSLINAVAQWSKRNWLVSASNDYTLKVWDLNRDQEVQTPIGHNGSVNALALWHERGWALSASKDHTLRLWDIKMGQEFYSLTEHTDSVTALALWQARGWAVVAFKNYTCKVLDLNRRQELYTFTQSHGWITDITLWPERGWAILSSTMDGTLKVWDLVRRQEVRTLEMVLYNALAKPVLWPERGWAILGSAWGTVDVWDLEQGQKVCTFTGDSGTATAMGHVLAGWVRSMEEAFDGLLGPVTAVALWPARGWVVSAFWNGTLKVWDLKRGQEVWTLPGHNGRVTPLALWPEHGLAVSASGDTLKVWDLEQGQEVHTLTGHQGPVTDVALWPERGLAVSTSRDTLKVWDLWRGGCLSTFMGESDITVCKAVAGGQILVIGEEKGRVHFFKLENYEETPEKPPQGSFRKWIRRVISSFSGA